MTDLALAQRETLRRSLQDRLAELRERVAEMETELREPLPADFEEQASELEGQDALEGLEKAARLEILQIDQALKRIADGEYGVCVQCGGPIAPKRLEAMPIATRCIACAA